MYPTAIQDAIFLALACIKLFGVFFITFMGGFSLFTLLHKDKGDRAYLAGLALGLGPALAGYVLTQLLRFFPGHSFGFYLGALLLPFLALSVFNFRKNFKFLTFSFPSYYKSLDDWLTGKITAFILTGALLFVLVLNIFNNFFMPVIGNDALLYFTAAREIANTTSMSNYPFATLEHGQGFYGGWTHGAGYVNLITLSYMVQGTTSLAGCGKMVAPYFTAATALLIWIFAAKEKALAGPIATILFVTTPLYFAMSIQSHTDPERVFTFTSALLCLYLYVKNPSAGMCVITGLALGMGVFSHSLGFMLFPLMVPLYWITADHSLQKRLVSTLVFLAIALCLMLPTMLTNYSTFGSIISDQVVEPIAGLHSEEFLKTTRFLVTPVDKIWHGVLAGFSSLKSFGLTYWFFFVAILGYGYTNRKKLKHILALKNKSWKQPNLLHYSFWVLLGYFGIIILSLPLIGNEFIKNSRYPLTSLPFITLIPAYIISILISHLTRNSIELASPSKTQKEDQDE